MRVGPADCVGKMPSALATKRAEQKIHLAVIQHLQARAVPGCFYWHTPNEGKRGKVEASVLKSIGLVAGVPDLVLIHKKRVYALELKTIIGRASKEQIATMQAMQTAGAIVAVRYGLDQAIEWLEEHGLLRGRLS